VAKRVVVVSGIGVHACVRAFVSAKTVRVCVHSSEGYNDCPSKVLNEYVKLIEDKAVEVATAISKEVPAKGKTQGHFSEAMLKNVASIRSDTWSIVLKEFVPIAAKTVGAVLPYCCLALANNGEVPCPTNIDEIGLIDIGEVGGALLQAEFVDHSLLKASDNTGLLTDPAAKVATKTFAQKYAENTNILFKLVKYVLTKQVPSLEALGQCAFSADEMLALGSTDYNQLLVTIDVDAEVASQFTNTFVKFAKEALIDIRRKAVDSVRVLVGHCVACKALDTQQCLDVLAKVPREGSDSETKLMDFIKQFFTVCPHIFIMLKTLGDFHLLGG
jgi:hypothetical protein